MSCIFNIKTDFLPDVTPGGEWELVGFSLTEGGAYGAGGSWPWTASALEDPQVDFDSIIQGYYKLNYFIGGTCGGSQEIIIPVVGKGDAGNTNTLDLCATSAPINITDELGTVFDGGVLEPGFVYSGTGEASAGFNLPNPNTPIGATFDPSLVTAGNYVVTLNITPQSPPGYSLANCCPPTSAALVINVAEGGIVISIDASCNISLVSTDGCSEATFELYKSTNSGASYTATGITSLPYQAQEAALWKWVGTDCDCGTADSNIVDSVNCCEESEITINFDPEFCSVGLFGSAGCSIGTWDGSYQWYRSCDNGQTWVHQPVHDDNDFIIVADDCQWQLIGLCTNGCKSFSNIVTATCGGSCTGNIAGAQLPCVYRAASGLFCDGGPLKLIKVGTGVVATEILSVGNTYPIDFPITSDGDYYASLDCGDGCPDRVGPTFTYAGCGEGGNPCDSVITPSLISCVLSVSVTNCPGAIYTFINPSGGTVYSGPNNAINVNEDGDWTILVDGCDDCTQLSEVFNVAGCGSEECNCMATISEEPCGMFTLSPQACDGYAIQWQFSNNSGASWSNVGAGGLTYNAAQNGRYRATLSKESCLDVITNEVDISCISAGCDCAPSISIDVDDCNIDWSTVGCVGFTATMQRLDGGNWVDVQVSPASPYIPLVNGTYRLKLEKAGCNTIYSDPVEVNCVGGFCQVAIDSMVINPADCSQVTINWSGAGGSSVTVQWAKATANTSSCVSASGWEVIGGGIATGASGDGTGYSTITLDPGNCDTCIRAIVDASGEGCGLDDSKIFVPCCCTDEPSITQAPEMASYEIRVYDDLDIIDKYNEHAVTGSSAPRITGSAKVTRNGIVIESNPFDLHLTSIDLRRLVQAKNSDPDYEVGAFVISVRFARADDDTIFDIPLSPSTAIFSGAGGTTSAAGLTYNGNGQDLVDAIVIAINNYLGALSLYSDFVVSFGSNGISIATSCKHEATDNYAGIKGSDPLFVWEQNGGAEYETTNISGNNSGASNVFVSSAPPCGSISTKLNIAPGNLSTDDSSHNFVSVELPNPTADYNNSGQTPGRTCSEYTLTVENYCIGATFLWSTLETGDSINVQPGDYSVVITCPDGCEYMLNITV